MAMPPKRAVPIIANLKVICEFLARRYGTLRDADCTVHSIVAAQLQSMPMQREAFIVSQIIGDVNNDTVAGARLDERPGKPVCQG